PTMYRDLERALATHYPDVKAPHGWLKLASWIGGDRDGNPFVKSDVTAETLRLHRGLVVENLRREFNELGRQLSVSSNRIPPPPELQAWIDKRRPFRQQVDYIANRYAHEPYRLVLSLLSNDLAEASRDDMTGHLLGTHEHRAHLNEKDLLEPLRLIASALPKS